MERILSNQAFEPGQPLLFAGDYEVVGPDPSLGHQEVAGLGVDMVLIHYHHRHEYEGGRPKGLWGTLYSAHGKIDWSELDHTVQSAKRHFTHVGLYPVGWAHMVPSCLGETVLDIAPEVLSEWVCAVVERYWQDVDLFPIFYEMNVFDLFYRSTHGQPYGTAARRHIVECLAACVDRVRTRLGPEAVAKLAAGTFVELTESSFYWMSEGELLELPRGSLLIDGPLSPPDLLAVAADLDAGHGTGRYLGAIRQLLHTMVFWNADDSGANNLVGDDLRRVVDHGWLYHPDHNPAGFVHTLIAGWDAQPQNTYQYLLERMLPSHRTPSPADCLVQNYVSFETFCGDNSIPEWSRQAVVGFVLDDVFKCRKQSGITSAVVPTELAGWSGRHATAPALKTDIGDCYESLISVQRSGGGNGLILGATSKAGVAK